MQAESVEERSKALNEAFTYALFVNVCRSLFEAHKIMFSFLLAIKILQNRKEIDPGMFSSCQAMFQLTPRAFSTANIRTAHIFSLYPYSRPLPQP